MSPKTIMISLIGEQPIPNLLPIRHLLPRQVLLAYTEQTRVKAERLRPLLPSGCQALNCRVSAYDLAETTRCLLTSIQENHWGGEDLLVNLTGGTKVMSLAAYVVAAHYRAPFIYVESEKGQSRLYHYEFDDQGHAHLAGSELLPALITIDDYLRAYVGEYTAKGFAADKGGLFEQAIYEALRPAVDEVMPPVWLRAALDVDLVVRCGNQVGIIEAKAASDRKQGIDQLTNAGGREYLGTYTQKVLVSDRTWDKRTNLRALAEARGIEVVELPSFGTKGQLSAEDTKRLQQTVCKRLGREARP